MPDVKIPVAQPGVAHFELSDTFINTHLLYGEHPKLTPAISGLAGADVRRFEVIGFNTAGEIVPATWNATPANAIKPIGIATAAAADGERVLYWTTGHFNLDNIVFNASFDTAAKRAVVFDGAPTPTLIRLTSRSA